MMCLEIGFLVVLCSTECNTVGDQCGKIRRSEPNLILIIRRNALGDKGLTVYCEHEEVRHPTKKKIGRLSSDRILQLTNVSVSHLCYTGEVSQMRCLSPLTRKAVVGTRQKGARDKKEARRWLVEALSSAPKTQP